MCQPRLNIRNTPDDRAAAYPLSFDVKGRELCGHKGLSQINNNVIV